MVAPYVVHALVTGLAYHASIVSWPRSSFASATGICLAYPSLADSNWLLQALEVNVMNYNGQKTIYSLLVKTSGTKIRG